MNKTIRNLAIAAAAIAACTIGTKAHAQDDLSTMMGLLGADADLRAQNECVYAPNPQGCLAIKRQQNQQGLSIMNGLFNGSITTEQDLMNQLF